MKTAQRLTTQFLAFAALATALSAPATAVNTGDPSAWRNDQPEQPAALIVRDATIWTSGPDGRLEEADLLIRNGKVSAVGVDLSAPSGAVEIDGSGKHVTPGLIDAHSHAAITGGVNEGATSQPPRCASRTSSTPPTSTSTGSLRAASPWPT